MPRYEYKCTHCGNEFTVSKPMAEVDREERCPRCDSRVVRSWGAVGIPRSAASSGCGGGSSAFS